jgi:hypothetical protein
MTLGRWFWNPLSAVVSLSILSAGGTPIKSSDLAAISERGILLASYDNAAWHGTDAIMALHPVLRSGVRSSSLTFLSLPQARLRCHA